mmetsp:Transcript_12595/g.35735  ORF Transcript_12595/g.35735 Transcript_12595/m.35735 type:complete len:87 (-) Transcript_12595:949-1209(-)
MTLLVPSMHMVASQAVLFATKASAHSAIQTRPWNSLSDSCPGWFLLFHNHFISFHALLRRISRPGSFLILGSRIALMERGMDVHGL